MMTDKEERSCDDSTGVVYVHEDISTNDQVWALSSFTSKPSQVLVSQVGVGISRPTFQRIHRSKTSWISIPYGATTPQKSELLQST